MEGGWGTRDAGGKEKEMLHTLLCEDVCHVYSTGAEEGRGLSEGRVNKGG